MTDLISTPAEGDRRALLAELLRRQAQERSFPLSYPQRRLWFLDQLQPESAVYNVPLGWDLRGPLDVDALERALSEVVRRHEVLRTVIRAGEAGPWQVVQPPAPVRAQLLDLRGEGDPHAAAERVTRAEAARPFDLAAGPLLRAVLLRVADDEHRLLLTIHHVVCDGWSVGVLAREMEALYRACLAGEDPALPPLPIQYGDFAHWQLRRLQGPVLDELLGYWRGRLGGAPALAGLPTDRPRPPVQTFRGAHLRFELPAAGVERLAALARREGTTLFAALLAAFVAVVQRWTGEDEVVVGTPVANRERPELEGLVGFFANTLVLRANLSGDPSFPELLRRVGAEARAAVAHQELPFERLVDELHPDRDLAQNPLFGVLFSYRDDEVESLALEGLRVRPVQGDSGTAKFDLTLSLARRPGGVDARLEYNTDLFDPATAERLAAQLCTLAAALGNDPDRPLSALPVLPSDERERLLREWNATDAPYDRAATVHGMIERQAARTPDAEALVADGRAWTYAEVDAAASRLARRLRALGVGPDVPAGVHLERSAQMLVAMLAILKAGGAYLPLDPAYPAERLALMVRDSGARVVVTGGAPAGWLAAAGAAVVRVDDPSLEAEDPAPPPPLATAGHLAYVIYTSGSTGTPKGVMVTHRNAAGFFAAMDRELGGDGPGTWLAVTSISFDISVLELLWTLARGFRVVVRREEAAAAGARAASVPAAVQARPIDLSLFYFGGDYGRAGDRYRLLLDGARFADRAGFRAVWTPERHFHSFGGLYPNPSVTGAAVAAITERVQIRAGSVVLPLHDPLRVAEEWSVVDNLSGGRVGVSFASGWQPNDFALAPDAYADRKERMMAGIDQVRRLWRGETVRRTGGTGAEVQVGVFPRPVQRELPVWITSARTPDTFRMAGEAGAGLLTHLVGHSPEQLAEKIALYRQAWRHAGHPGDGHVTLMLHTFVGTDVEQVRETVRDPLCAYLKTSFDLLSGLGVATGTAEELRRLPDEELDALVRQAFGRFFDTAALLGTPEGCADVLDRLKQIGVDEAACLIDFGVDEDAVLASLEHLARARDISEARRRAALEDAPVAEQVARFGVTHLQCTPSYARMLLADPESRAALRPLRRLLVGGEALPPDLARELAEGVSGQVVNVYGPTEATVWATSHPVRAEADGPVPIGGPLANVRAYVVDRRGGPAPTGAPGELLLGGEGVVRGYLGRPGLTAERFVPDPFGPQAGARLYRTGDLARRRADGRLEFLGRLDHQVKVRGHRIELGEVEAVLARHPGVAAAVAAARGEGAHARVVAYVVPRPGADPPLPDALRAWAAESLPEYMVPSAVVALPAFPLTPNGKVDRRALPDPDAAPRPRAEFKPPESALERTIAGVWGEVLRRDGIGADDNFFSLGGNSLLIVQVRARLQEQAGGALSLVDMFRYPTVSALAAALEGRAAAPAGAALEAVQDAAERRKAALARQGRIKRDRRAP